MVDDALAGTRMIGMIQPDMAARANGHKDAILTTGCMGRITQFAETGDGRYTIMLTGLNRFRIEEELDSPLPYRQAKVNWAPYKDDLVEDCDTIEIDRAGFIPLLKQYFDKHEIECDWEVVHEAPCQTLLTTLPMVCPFAAQEKQALLEAKTMEQRFETLTTLLTIALNSGGDTSSQTQ